MKTSFNLNTFSNTLIQSLDIEYNEYYTIFGNNILKIIIGRIENEIIINCKNYMITFNLNDFFLLTKMQFNSINEAYDFIINIFEENNCIIKKIIKNKEIKLIFNLNNNKQMELILLYNKENKDFIVKEINKLKIENIQLKKEISILKRYHENDSNEAKIKDIKELENINNDSYAHIDVDNSFTVFKAINNLIYLVYSNKNKSIICQNLINQKIIKELKNCHKEYITNLRHCLDKIKNKDFVMSISSKDNNLKLWNAENWKCILNIDNVNKNGFLYSACFLRDDNNIYIATSNAVRDGESENIKIFDFKGKKIKEINKSNKTTFILDTYFDNNLNKNFIISGNKKCISSYNYDSNYLFHQYYERHHNKFHGSLHIKKNEEITQLIESCEDGVIRIWDFYSALLLKKIKVGDLTLYSICLWNNNYLFVGCEDKTIKLINLNNDEIINTLTGHNNFVITIKKISHLEYGEFLISQGLKDDKIKIWHKEK